jgi:hypothetical protein
MCLVPEPLREPHQAFPKTSQGSILNYELSGICFKFRLEHGFMLELPFQHPSFSPVISFRGFLCVLEAPEKVLDCLIGFDVVLECSWCRRIQGPSDCVHSLFLISFLM